MTERLLDLAPPAGVEPTTYRLGALARLVGWSASLKRLAQRMRCSQCGKKAAEAVAVARPRPRC